MASDVVSSRVVLIPLACLCTQDHGTAKTNMFESTADKFAASFDVVEEQLKYETIGESCVRSLQRAALPERGLTSDLSVDL